MVKRDEIAKACVGTALLISTVFLLFSMAVSSGLGIFFFMSAVVGIAALFSINSLEGMLKSLPDKCGNFFTREELVVLRFNHESLKELIRWHVFQREQKNKFGMSDAGKAHDARVNELLKEIKYARTAQKEHEG